MIYKFDKKHVMTAELQDAAIDVLAVTRDGNELTERELALCEYAVNGKLSPLGAIVFIDLYRRAVSEYSGA